MRFALLAGLASLASSVSATALTYRLEANEKACFYSNVEQANAKVAFYFAVSLRLGVPCAFGGIEMGIDFQGNS